MLLEIIHPHTLWLSTTLEVVWASGRVFGVARRVQQLYGSPFKFTVAKHCFGKIIQIFHLDMGPCYAKIGFGRVSAKKQPGV